MNEYEIKEMEELTDDAKTIAEHISLILTYCQTGFLNREEAIRKYKEFNTKHQEYCAGVEAFTEMLELVEQRRVRTIIVKDLSRLGRNYLEVGHYTEVVFPENKVRFIAITDGVDSAAGDNEFAPFKNIINEWYAKDISRKVKSAFKAKALRGEYTGAYPPYGYDRDPNDRHKLVPNQYAWVIKEIFQMALAGKSCSIIAKELGEKQVLRPQAYLQEKFGTFASDIVLTYPYA